MTVRRFTRAGFRKWLARHEPGEIVGFADSVTYCPLANFGGVDWVDQAPIDDWRSEFIETIDSMYPKFYHPISAATALRVLDGLPKRCVASHDALRA